MPSHVGFQLSFIGIMYEYVVIISNSLTWKVLNSGNTNEVPKNFLTALHLKIFMWLTQVIDSKIHFKNLTMNIEYDSCIKWSANAQLLKWRSGLLNDPNSNFRPLQKFLHTSTNVLHMHLFTEFHCVSVQKNFSTLQDGKSDTNWWGSRLHF